MNDQQMEKITQGVVAGICMGVAGFLALVASVALFGPHIVPYMNKLPW